MHVLAIIGGALLLVGILEDAFETVILARRAQRRVRITRLFYRATWAPFRAIARRVDDGRRREHYLSIYGPLSLLALLAFWATGLIFAFAFLQWAAGLTVQGARADILDAIYYSGSTFFTLGLTGADGFASKALTVLEAGLGFSFLAMVIGYLPILYQSFSARETHISLLDARAGSPPSAAEFVSRQGNSPEKLETQFARWEEWAAELLESQLSYPMLSYFRSQHTNQSWLSALTAIIDASALTIAAGEGELKRQAELTFAMGRHALVDLATVFHTEPKAPRSDRLPARELSMLISVFQGREMPIRAECIREQDLKKMRETYEPYANALGLHFLMALPPWLPAGEHYDNWQVTAWGRTGAPFAVSDPFSRSSKSERKAG